MTSLTKSMVEFTKLESIVSGFRVTTSVHPVKNGRKPRYISVISRVDANTQVIGSRLYENLFLALDGHRELIRDVKSNPVKYWKTWTMRYGSNNHYKFI